MSVYDSSHDALIEIGNTLDSILEELRELRAAKKPTHGVKRDGSWITDIGGLVVCGTYGEMAALAETQTMHGSSAEVVALPSE